MATYKVIQDVEADDKLLGPLTLRQFVYAGICAISLYLTYFVATKGFGFMAAVFLPIAAVAGFFAFPWGSDQPTEVWALARIRFMLKPRRRIWNQSGVKELVTVTAPKVESPNYTNGLSQTEVHSRLRALADTIDSRGWAIKNANLNTYSTSLVMDEPGSDRLIGPSVFPQEVESVSDVQASDDILDEKNNLRAQQMDSMIAKAQAAHRQKIMDTLQAPEPAVPEAPKPKPANPYWFLNQPTQSSSIPANMVTFNTQVVTPGMSQDDPVAASTGGTPPITPDPVPDPAMDDAAPNEDELVKELAARKQELPTTAYYSHLHTIQPLSAQQQDQQQAQAGQQSPQPALQQPMARPMPQPQQAMPAPQMPAPAIPTPNVQQGGDVGAHAIPAFRLPTQDEIAAQLPPAGHVTPWQPPEPTPQPAQPPVTPAKQAAILQLANNDDLNVATLAREAHRADEDEVVIKLH